MTIGDRIALAAGSLVVGGVWYALLGLWFGLPVPLIGN